VRIMKESRPGNLKGAEEESLVAPLAVRGPRRNEARKYYLTLDS